MSSGLYEVDGEDTTLVADLATCIENGYLSIVEDDEELENILTYGNTPFVGTSGKQYAFVLQNEQSYDTVSYNLLAMFSELKDIYFAHTYGKRWILTGQPTANLICENNLRYEPYGAKSLNGVDYDYADSDVLTTDVRVMDGYDNEEVEEINLTVPSDTSQHAKKYSILRADPQINFDIVSGIPTNVEVHFVDEDYQDITSQMTGKISAYIMTREAYAQTGDQTLHDIAPGRYVLLVQTESNASSLIGEDFSLKVEGTDKNGNEFVNDYGPITMNLTAPAPERAGLYGSSEAFPQTGGTQLKTWSQLVSDGVLSVDANGVVSPGENTFEVQSNYNGYRIEVPDNVTGFNYIPGDETNDYVDVHWYSKILNSFSSPINASDAILKLPNTFANNGDDSSLAMGFALVYYGSDDDAPYEANWLNPPYDIVNFDQSRIEHTKGTNFESFNLETTPPLSNDESDYYRWVIDTSNTTYHIYSDLEGEHELQDSGINITQNALGGFIDDSSAQAGTYYIRGEVVFEQPNTGSFNKTYEVGILEYVVVEPIEPMLSLDSVTGDNIGATWDNVIQLTGAEWGAKNYSSGNINLNLKSTNPVTSFNSATIKSSGAYERNSDTPIPETVISPVITTFPTASSSESVSFDMNFAAMYSGQEIGGVPGQDIKIVFTITYEYQSQTVNEDVEIIFEVM